MKSVKSAGRILALDYGDKRIGVAVTDPARTMVFPRSFFVNTGWESVFLLLRDFCREEGVGQIVLGCPYDDAHVENAQTEKVRKFGAGLGEVCGLPVDYEDEKYTTAEAEALLSSSGEMSFREKKEARDSVAAMLILQSYLKRV